MYHNYTFNDVNDALPTLLLALDGSPEIGSRAGKTKEMTHVGITLMKPRNREILLPGRKANIAAQIAETMWVLAGRDDLEFLKNYLPRAAEFSDDGETWRAGYGNRLRRWADHGHATYVDQWRWLVAHLKANPESRRAVMSIWDPVVDTKDGKDIPCNDWLSFSLRNGHLDLHVAVRSNDAIWGWSGINEFEWSTMLEITAGLVGAEVGSLHFSVTSFHIYDRHWSKSAKIREHAYRVSGLKPSPRFDGSVFDHNFDTFDSAVRSWFDLEKAIRQGDMVESLVDAFPEPMMRSWLRVLQWWWSGESEYLSVLEDTRLERATKYAVQPPPRTGLNVQGTFQVAPIEPAATLSEALRITTGLIAEGGHVPRIQNLLRKYGVQRVSELALVDIQPYLDDLTMLPESEFLSTLCALHLEKEKAYGGSWKKRGELFSILPNVGRKVDRLQGGQTEDETSADTAGDLFVYLAKYKTWLDEFVIGGDPLWDGLSDVAENANEIMRRVERTTRWPSAVTDRDMWKGDLVRMYEEVLVLAEKSDPARRLLVEQMLPVAYLLARTLWEDEKPADEYLGADHD